MTLRDPASELLKYSPVGRVPALLTDDGRVYAETVIVCELLDAMHPGPRLIPLEGVARREALRLEGQAAGFVEGVAWWVRELRRAPEERSSRLLEVECQRARRCLDALEASARAEAFAGPLRIAHITTACTLGLADAFLREEDWRRARPALDAWYAMMSQRASMRVTVPVVTA